MWQKKCTAVELQERPLSLSIHRPVTVLVPRSAKNQGGGGDGLEGSKSQVIGKFEFKESRVVSNEITMLIHFKTWCNYVK